MSIHMYTCHPQCLAKSSNVCKFNNFLPASVFFSSELQRLDYGRCSDQCGRGRLLANVYDALLRPLPRIKKWELPKAPRVLSGNRRCGRFWHQIGAKGLI